MLSMWTCRLMFQSPNRHWCQKPITLTDDKKSVIYDRCFGRQQAACVLNCVMSCSMSADKSALTVAAFYVVRQNLLMF